jgi:hypothetical protein
VRAADTHYSTMPPHPSRVQHGAVARFLPATCAASVLLRGCWSTCVFFPGVGAVPVHASTAASADLPLLAEPPLGVDTSKDRSSGRPRGLLYPSRLFFVSLQ